MQKRSPEPNDWPRVKELADVSVADIPGAGSQDEWLINRKQFTTVGEQKHFVCVDDDRIVGYGSLERAADAPAGHCRMFLVTAPEALDSVGPFIFEELQELASCRNISRSCFVEYSEDPRLLGFLRKRGYRDCGTIALEPDVTATVVERFHAGD